MDVARWVLVLSQRTETDAAVEGCESGCAGRRTVLERSAEVDGIDVVSRDDAAGSLQDVDVGNAAVAEEALAVGDGDDACSQTTRNAGLTRIARPGCGVKRSGDAAQRADACDAKREATAGCAPRQL